MNDAKSNDNDLGLIAHFQEWRRYHRFNLSEAARLVGRSRSWATLLEQGKITSLSQETRDNIKFLLGIS